MVSKYFNNYPLNNTSEQSLIENLMNEVVHISGADVFYLPKTSLSGIDQLYGEDTMPTFNSAPKVEVYVKNVDAFGGPSEFFAKFGGMEIRDNINLILTKRNFNKNVPQLLRPREGDLIYISTFNDIYEIMFVEEESDFHSLGRKAPDFYYYELKCEKFRFNNERFNTGIDEIDQIAKDYAYTIAIDVVLPANTSRIQYTVGEQVYQGANLNTASAIAYVKNWNQSSNNLQVMSITGEFNVNSSYNIVGTLTGATWQANSFNSQSFSAVVESLADNELIQTEADAIIIDTDNPFGIP